MCLEECPESAGDGKIRREDGRSAQAPGELKVDKGERGLMAKESLDKVR